MVEYAVAPGILKRREALGLPHDGLPIPARLSALCPEVGALEVLALIFIRRTHEGVTAVQAAGLRGAVAWRLDANRPENPCLGFGDSDPRRAAR